MRRPKKPQPLWTGSEWSYPLLKKAYDAIEKIALEEMNLDVYRNQIEILGSEQMIDMYTSIGMPIYYKHWSFGKRFTEEWASYKQGHSGLAYELVINSNPCINYLMEENTMTTQALVIAHAAFGHNHFFKNNYLFKQWTDADGIIDYLIFARDYVAQVEEREGIDAVETFLDSCHALMDHGVNRYKRPPKLSASEERRRQEAREAHREASASEMDRIIPISSSTSPSLASRSFPAQPEENILYFCEKHAPSLKGWQRELIRIVRKIAQYFYPQAQTKVMNEGFASITHYEIMNRLHDRGLTTDGTHLEFLALHGNVLFQPSFDDKRYSGLNPYKLGFEILKDIMRICSNPTDEDRRTMPGLIGKDGWGVILDAVANFRDESFVRQFLSPKVIRDMRLFRLTDDRESPKYRVSAVQDDKGWKDVREALADSHERHQWVPHLEAVHVDPRSRMLTIRHEPFRGRPLSDPQPMMRHIRRLWGDFPVKIVDIHGYTVAET